MALHTFYCDAAPTAQAQHQCDLFKRHAVCVDHREQADAVVVFGGDGYMLDALHRHLASPHIPVYGINCGTVGFLMNAKPHETMQDVVVSRIQAAIPTILHPLRIEYSCVDGTTGVTYAINDAVLHRQTHQICGLDVMINGQLRLHHLRGDGVLVATAAGSTAYNYSAHGPIIPLGIPLLALTPLHPCSPRHWRGAIVPNSVMIECHVHDAVNRPVVLNSDHIGIPNIAYVCIYEDTTQDVCVLFDAGHQLEERIIREQFSMPHDNVAAHSV